MNEEPTDFLKALYTLEIVKEMYNQRLIDQESYMKYLVTMASGVVEFKIQEQ